MIREWTRSRGSLNKVDDACKQTGGDEHGDHTHQGKHAQELSERRMSGSAEQ